MYNQLKVHYTDLHKNFSIQYQKNKPNNKIDKQTEPTIIKELKKAKKLINDKNNPIRFCNYSYVKQRLENDYGINVPLSSVILRAKKMGITKKNL